MGAPVTDLVLNTVTFFTKKMKILCVEVLKYNVENSDLLALMILFKNVVKVLLQLYVFILVNLASYLAINK